MSKSKIFMKKNKGVKGDYMVSALFSINFVFWTALGICFFKLSKIDHFQKVHIEK